MVLVVGIGEVVSVRTVKIKMVAENHPRIDPKGIFSEAASE